MRTTLIVETTGPGLFEITAAVDAALPPRDGFATLFVRHTSASLTVQENHDPEVLRDLQGWMERMVPSGDHPSMGWLTHTYEGPDDMPGHIRAALLPVSLHLPVRAGRLDLGRWQGVFLWEHRTRPHRREVVVGMA